MRLALCHHRRNMRQYCEDIDCPNLEHYGVLYGENGDNCGMGYINKFRIPRDMMEVVTHDWGYVMPKICFRYRKKVI